MGEIYKDYVTHPDGKGSINISEEVIAAIAASAVMDTDGVIALSSKETSDRPGKKSRSAQRGVKIYVEDEIIMVDVWLVAKMGVSVNETAQKVQQAVTSNIESMTGFSVSEVNVHVVSVASGRSK